MFGKDELAAILKFGAEELFKEDEAKTEQRQNQMLHEDLESILARAEVSPCPLPVNCASLCSLISDPMTPVFECIRLKMVRRLWRRRGGGGGGIGCGAKSADV